MSALCKILPGRRDLLMPAAAFPQRYPCLLESAVSGGRHARHDLLLYTDGDFLSLSAQGLLSDRTGTLTSSDFFAELDRRWQSLRLPMASDDLPFHGGWALFLAYEMAGAIESRLCLRRDPGLPLALALRCPAAILVDHQAQETILVAEPGREDLLRQMEQDLAGSFEPPLPPPPRLIEEDPAEIFLEGVARIHRHLLDGETFQVNLSRAWRAFYAQSPSPASLYKALREANPAPFAGLLQQPGWAVVSSSPERLVQSRGGLVQTRPIAGTRPRLAGEDEAARIQELSSNPKERAEHVMLIDLERNDLGRVCQPGTVSVDELMAVESYAHVHHIVSNVSGLLRQDITPGQLIAATFPGGTITGCPKVRCMQIIGALEGAPRGVYTGALGYLDRSGDLDLNILIRSLRVSGEQVELRAGAGIVADSLASSELEETRAKARGMLRAIGTPG